MAHYDFTSHRLFVAGPLAEATHVGLRADQANYLINVLRLESGARLLVFNGCDGEWRARLERSGKRDAKLVVEARVREQPGPGDLHLAFAPLKHARLDYMIQKAVEMGASRLLPVLTRRTQVHRVNLARMRANAIEAAEQCGVLSIPVIDEPVSLDALLADWPEARRLIFCDEDAPLANPFEVLKQAHELRPTNQLALLIGPEGGFDPAERDKLQRMTSTLAISLGPRILRADTAAVAALAVVQAALGDWRQSAI